jgi:hypothetical protein
VFALSSHMFSGDTDNDNDSASSTAHSKGTSLDSISVRNEEATVKDLERSDTNDEAMGSEIELTTQQVCGEIYVKTFFASKPDLLL